MLTTCLACCVALSVEPQPLQSLQLASRQMELLLEAAHGCGEKIQRICEHFMVVTEAYARVYPAPMPASPSPLASVKPEDRSKASQAAASANQTPVVSCAASALESHRQLEASLYTGNAALSEAVQRANRAQLTPYEAERGLRLSFDSLQRSHRDFLQLLKSSLFILAARASGGLAPELQDVLYSLNFNGFFADA